MTSKIILLRHAKAYERSLWNDKGKTDQSRPLTTLGIQQFTDSLESIKALIPKIDLIISSHWLRAVKTAQLMHQKYPQAQLLKDSSLNPDGSETQHIKFFNKNTKSKTICLVGHQPDLSYLLCLLLNQSLEDSYNFKKGGLAILELKNKAWVLDCFISRKHLLSVKGDG
jgi:phosphohistidine phosphatase